MPRSADPFTQTPLHPLAFQVLLVLMDGNFHGYGIAKAIERKEVGLGRVYPTNLYRRLRDMVRDGFIDEEKTSSDDGARRSTFVLTPVGRKAAEAEARRLEATVLDARRYRLLPHQGDR